MKRLISSGSAKRKALLEATGLQTEAFLGRVQWVTLGPWPPPRTCQRPTNPLEGVEDWVCRHTRQWCEMCDEFKEATRQTILARLPSDSELEEHRKEMKIFLHMTRLLHAEVADPDFPDRSLAAELAIRVRQMEDLWEMIHNPMPDDEADKLLRGVFPK